MPWNVFPETYLNQKSVALPWLARGPDLASIEHVWDILVRYNHNVRPHLQMITALRLERVEVPQNDIRTIIGSTRHRSTACMRADGGHTSN